MPFNPENQGKNQKPAANLSKEDSKVIEQKYIEKIKQDYTKVLESLKQDTRNDTEALINSVYNNLSIRLNKEEGFSFGERQQVILKLKLGRYFQNKEKFSHYDNRETLDTNSLVDALIESPKFIQTDKGSLNRLFEIHIQKTIQKIAELRRKRAEMAGQEGLNPFEALFETESGDYYMARLLNMPHLEDESLNMGESCVGTSDHYYKEILNGNIEILSLREIPKINKKTNKLEGDVPVVTIEYNLKSKIIEQIKKYDDESISKKDPYYEDIIDALKKLRETKTDTGEYRDFKKINEDEMEKIRVRPDHILTEKGEVYFRDFNPEDNSFILKIGNMEITPNTSKENASKKIYIIEGKKINPDEIAYLPNEINKNTKIYIGPLNEKGIFDKVLKLESVYTNFPNRRIESFELDENIQYPKNKEAWIKILGEKKITKRSGATEMLEKMENTILPKGQKFIKLGIADLGFSKVTNKDMYDKGESLGLELCAEDDGPKICLAYKEINNDELKDTFTTAMKAIKLSSGDLRLWGVNTDGISPDTVEKRHLYWTDGKFDHVSDRSETFVFRLPITDY